MIKRVQARFYSHDEDLLRVCFSSNQHGIHYRDPIAQDLYSCSVPSLDQYKSNSRCKESYFSCFPILWIEALTSYLKSKDDRLAKKDIHILAASILSSGQLQSRYISEIPQVVPLFSLYWIGMFYDHALMCNFYERHPVNAVTLSENEHRMSDTGGFQLILSPG
jgi:hypothetical protein